MSTPQLNRVTFGKGEDVTMILRSRDNDANTITGVVSKLRACLPNSFEVDAAGTVQSASTAYIAPSGLIKDGYSILITAAQADALPRGNYILDAVLSIGSAKKLTTKILVTLANSASG